MARIYFSYSINNVVLAKSYLDALSNSKHEIVLPDPEKAFEKSLSASLERADCVIFLLGGRITDRIRSEAEFVFVNHNSRSHGEKLVIVLNNEEFNARSVNDLEKFPHINIYRRPVDMIVQQIEDMIRQFLNDRNAQPPANPRKSSSVEASSAPQRSAEAELGLNYWLLKINGRNWNVDQLELGKTGYFNASFNERRKRPDYEMFEDLKTGDKGLAYEYSVKKKVVFLFTIVDPLYSDKVLGEVVNFRIDEITMDGSAVWERLSGLDFAGELDELSLRKLFILTEAQYAEIYTAAVKKVEGPRSPGGAKRLLSRLFADTAVGHVKDELDFTSDVNALASVMAYREVKPPLAIGLFGNWGSGKSFFMNILQKRIDELSGDPGTVFCKKVLQINFNSWHYSDSNLWASLITKIFEELDKFGKEKPDELGRLFKNLHSTQELLQEKKAEELRVHTEKTALEKKKVIFEEEVERQSTSLKTLSLEEILEGLLKNESIQKELKTLDDKYGFLELQEIDEIEGNLQKMDGLVDKVIESLKLSFSFMKNWKLVQVVAFFLLILGGISFLIANVDWLRGYLQKMLAFIGTLSTILTALWAFLRPARKIVDTAFEKLNSLHKTVEGLKAAAKDKFRAEQGALQRKLDEARSASEEIEREISLLKIEESKLQTEIDDISSGKKIIRFIESRVADVRYVNSLGIISWIRKDFEQLDMLLTQSQTASNSLREVAPEAKAFQLERIILYIDDLDRCSAPIVVKVLEAIHLLLAFPLFVVVVGVDPRWMHRALNTQYGSLLSANKGQGEEIADVGGNDTGAPASSYDYLEKIFQVPFALKPIDQKGKGDLIRSQLESQRVAATNVPNIATGPRPVEAGGELPTAATAEHDEVVIPEQKVPEAAVPVGHIESENLQLTDDEINFMEQIAFLIGDSPRTIKRYINMYRIIRTHSRFSVEGDDPNAGYFSTMVLLAIITGLPETANELFGKLKDEKDTTTFGEFVEKHVVPGSARPEAVAEMKAVLNGPDVRAEMIRGLAVSVFKRNIGLVSRFSFRNIE